MQSLKDLDIHFCYRSDKDDLVRDFFVPTLKLAVEYKRAVGFFSSSALKSLSRGLEGLLFNGGSMKIIASPQLSEDDAKAIDAGYKQRESACVSMCSQIVAKLDWSIELEVLSWLIATNRLNIKLALRSNTARPGIYHEKLGIIKDTNGDFVTFSGSANESVSAHEYNFESLDIDKSWDDRRQVTAEKEHNFDALWENRTSGLAVFDFPEAAKLSLIQKRRFDNLDDLQNEIEVSRYHTETSNKEGRSPGSVIPRIPAWLRLRPYQISAIKNWRDNRCRGIFKMATGTGKTKTALAASVALFEACQKAPAHPALAIVIICPYKHLVTQWADDCKDFGLSYLCCFDSRENWVRQADQMVTEMNFATGPNKYCCFITTYKSFSLDSFQNLLKSLNSGKLLLIADEAHNLTDAQISNLPDARFRIGLSATPERWFDEDGTKVLQEYFGETVIEFGLKDALEGKFLTPYDYYPVIVEFTEDEAEKYLKISRRLSQLFAFPETNRNQQLIEKLQLQRARIQASAANKTVRLFELIREKYLNEKHMLIYCGDGRVEISDDENQEESIQQEDADMRQIDFVVKFLGNELNMRVHPFTSAENMETRNNIRVRFAVGELQALVAIRCLDEGVDIPATRTAFILASSTNPRQFIQRRGRVLRLSPETGKEFATIYDFIVILPEKTLSVSDFKIERALLEKELTRVNEFANLARNKNAALSILLELKKTYNLLNM